MHRRPWLWKTAPALAIAGLSLTGLTGAVGTASASTAKATGAFPTVPKNTQVTITFATYMASLGAAGVAEINTLLSGFKALHPNITVNVENENTAGGTSAIDAQIQQDEVAGKTPDVVQDAFNDLKFITKYLGAADLSKVVGAAGLSAEFGGRYRMTPAVAKLGVVNGDVYGIPYTLSTPILFYNANLFKQAGLNPLAPPTSWAQVQSDANAIKSSTGAAGIDNGCFGAGASGADWCLQAIIDSNGGSVMNKAQTKLTLTNPKTVSALAEMQSLAGSGAMVNLTTAQQVQGWASGKLTMILNSSALQSTLVSADNGQFSMVAARMPGFGTTPATPTNSGSALFMLSKSKLQREADWELMQYLTDPTSESTITENVGYPPLRPTIAEVSQYLGTWAKQNSFLPPNLAQLEHISPWLAYPGPNFNSIQTIVLNAAANIIYQGANPSSTLAAAQSQASALLP